MIDLNPNVTIGQILTLKISKAVFKLTNCKSLILDISNAALYLGMDV